MIDVREENGLKLEQLDPREMLANWFKKKPPAMPVVQESFNLKYSGAKCNIWLKNNSSASALLEVITDANQSEICC